MENPFKRVIKKLWYRQMLKSEELPQNIAREFFIRDSIDPLKFRENYAYYLSLKGRYTKYEPTSSCFPDPADLPLAFPRWFGAAYPDVVKYISNLEETEFTSLFENLDITQDELRDYENQKVWEIGKQELHHFTLEVLYLIKEGYKKLHPRAKLECQ